MTTQIAGKGGVTSYTNSYWGTILDVAYKNGWEPLGVSHYLFVPTGELYHCVSKRKIKKTADALGIKPIYKPCDHDESDPNYQKLWKKDDDIDPMMYTSNDSQVVSGDDVKGIVSALRKSRKKEFHTVADQLETISRCKSVVIS